PAKITINTTTPRVQLTGLQVFNQPVEVGDTLHHHVILQKAISETESITLRYDENIFTLEFAALGFINNHKTRYAYRLKGFNDNWLYTDGNTRKATYTNLDPGKYTFYVKASDERGKWSAQEVAVTIVVLPPFWLSPWAYVLYVLIGLALLYVARRLVIQQT